MFLPQNHEEHLQLIRAPDPESENSTRIRSIVANRERRFIAITTDDTVYIWLANPRLLLCSLKDDNLWGENHPKGQLRNVYWRPDSMAIAVTTNRNQIFIYLLDIQMSETCYNFVDSQDPDFQRTAKELFLRNSRPVVNLRTQTVINLADTAKCCVPLRDELIVCLTNGFTHHIDWSGQISITLSFRLVAIPFSNDQLQSKSERIASTSICISDIVYAPLIGGYCIVLSDGRAALLTSNDPNFSPTAILGVWAQGLVDATCCDVNHKYLLLMFGCRNGDICAYNIDEMTGGLVQTFRVSPKVANGPDFTNRIGSVAAIRVASNCHGFAATWNPATDTNPLPPLLACFTAFGAQSFCNLEGFCEGENGGEETKVYTSLEWGPEGYQLWIGGSNTLKVQSFVRSSSCSSPIMEHCDRAVLLSDSHVLISSAREREADACAPHAVWDHISVTHEYLSANWPLRYASTDRKFAHLVVAGERGFAYCSLITRRWKIFGNESQENNLIVTGGMFIWNELVIGVVGVNVDSEKSQLSFYPLSEKLDNRFASVVELETKATMVALRDDICAIFDINAQIVLFKLTAHLDDSRDSYAKVSADVVSVIRINELVPHPACVLSIQMTTLNLDFRGKPTPVFHSTIDTVLINIAGRLITLSVNEDGKLHQPMVIASYVEKMWHDRCIVENNNLSTVGGWNRQNNKNHRRIESIDLSLATSNNKNTSHLNNALWIACGAKGIKVWMPLIPGKRSTSSQEMTFIAKRIMLPFDLDIYPIIISAKDCLAIGVESQTQLITRKCQMYALHRNSEVFVHHLLRQLLKRNLGVFALELAASCRALPHFSHSLELLLHGVLEEEATSSEPIPDPLLPRCVAFIHEFPEFLKTIAHCARKTELALWPALFDVTGSPIALFEECLKLGQLENAASFVIVLQNFENTDTSMEQASRLVLAALEAKKWSIVKEMVRFAKSIGSEDMDSAHSPPPSAKTSIVTGSRRPTVSSPSPSSSANDEFFVNRFQATAGKLTKIRHSETSTTTPITNSSNRKDSLENSKQKVGREPSSPMSFDAQNKLAVRMYSILEQHCWKLLNEYWILDLGNLWSELQFDLIFLLETRRKNLLLGSPNHQMLIQDFPLALTRLHAQFSWPYPVIGTKFVHQIEKKLGALRTSRSSASLSNQVEDSEPERSTEIREKVRVVGENEQQKGEEEEEEEEEEEIVREAELKRIHASSAESTSSPRSSIIRSSSKNNVSTSTSASSVAGDWQNAEYLVGGGAARPRGSLQHGAQLEYMLKVFAQTCAIDWIFLLCLINRDERRLWQEIQPSIIKKCGEQNFARIRFACAELARWAVEKCCGYVSLLQAFDAHLTVVAEQAGIADLKYSPKGNTENATTENGRKSRMGAGGGKLGNSFVGGGRERSRSVDRIQKSVKRYDDVVCADDVLEKVDDEGCSIM